MYSTYVHKCDQREANKKRHADRYRTSHPCTPNSKQNKCSTVSGRKSKRDRERERRRGRASGGGSSSKTPAEQRQSNPRYVCVVTLTNIR